MTVQSTLARISYTVSGAGPYSVPFLFIDNSDIKAYSTTGGATPLVLGSDYTLSGADDDNGGTMTLLSPVDGDDLVIINDPEPTQLTVYQEYGKFPAKQHERGLDKITILVNRALDIASRGVKFPDNSPASGELVPEANKYIGWNSDGTLLVNLSGTGNITDSLLVYHTLINGIVSNVRDTLRSLEAIGHTVTPIDVEYGGVGDGVADDTAAVKAALESGYPVNGLGLTYAINGECAPTSFKGLYNANFVQIGDRSATNYKTLKLVGSSGFFIRDITVDTGEDVDTLFGDDGNGGVYIGGTAFDDRISNFHVSGVRVTGNGCGSGFEVRHATNFVTNQIVVHDRISGSTPDPTNDTQNGIEFVDCHKYVIGNSAVDNLQTRLLGVPTIRWTRGYLFAACTKFAVSNCTVSRVDQGFDFSGGYVPATEYYGNRYWTQIGCVASDCKTFGFKYANVTSAGTVVGCLASDIGSIGFVFSPAVYEAGIDNYLTSNIEVIACKAVNMLGNGYSSGNATGFRIMGGGGGSATYPRKIRFKNCSVSDTQAVPTTTAGFASDAGLVTYPTTGYDKDIANYVLGCTVGDEVTTPFSGLTPPLCTITGTGTQSITNSVYSKLAWDQDSSDALGMHNTSSNSENIYIKVTGWYEVHTQVQLASNSAGYRIIRMYKGASTIDRSTVIAPPVNGNATTVSSTARVFLKAGEYVSVEVWQNGAATLNVNLNESVFSATYMG